MRIDRIAKGSPVSAAAINRMAEAVERGTPGIAFGGGGGGNSFGGGWHIRRRPSLLSSGSLDLSQFAFGVTIDGAVATVAAGYVYRGHRDVIAVATADVTITATDQYIPLAVNATAGTAAIETPTTTLPQPDSTTFRIWLVKCTLSGGAAEIATIGHVGNLYLPGVGA